MIETKDWFDFDKYRKKVYVTRTLMTLVTVYPTIHNLIILKVVDQQWWPDRTIYEVFIS